MEWYKLFPSHQSQAKECTNGRVAAGHVRGYGAQVIARVEAQTLGRVYQRHGLRSSWVDFPFWAEGISGWLGLMSMGSSESTSRSILDSWTSSPQLDSLEVSRSLLPFLSDTLDYGYHLSTVHSHNNTTSPHRVFRLDTLTNRKDFCRLTIFLYLQIMSSSRSHLASSICWFLHNALTKAMFLMRKVFISRAKILTGLSS